MPSTKYVQLAALLGIVAVLFAGIDGSVFTAGDKAELVKAHDYFRRLVVREQGASNIRKMEWDDTLAQWAENWVQKCDFNHSKQWTRPKLVGKTFAGENLWLGDPEVLNLTGVVAAWYNEVRSYNYSAIKCNHVCGHYTQVVWFKTYKVGCSVTENGQCPQGRILSCNYAPGGNLKDTYPFSKGPPCSGCTEEWKSACVDGLCSRENKKACDPENHSCTNETIDTVHNSSGQIAGQHTFIIILYMIAFFITKSLATFFENDDR